LWKPATRGGAAEAGERIQGHVLFIGGAARAAIQLLVGHLNRTLENSVPITSERPSVAGLKLIKSIAEGSV
jgi:hypothetical protein